MKVAEKYKETAEVKLPEIPADCDDRKKIHVSPGVVAEFDAGFKAQYAFWNKMSTAVPKFYASVNEFTEKVSLLCKPALLPKLFILPSAA